MVCFLCRCRAVQSEARCDGSPGSRPTARGFVGNHDSSPQQCVGKRTIRASLPPTGSVCHPRHPPWLQNSKPLRSRPSNMKSALEHPEVVSAYLAQEKLLNRMAVVHSDVVPRIHCHISPFGVIPKKAKPGHWRLIVDLSSPENASINDGIDKDMCSTSYITTDSVVDRILQVGRGAGKGRHPAGVSDCWWTRFYRSGPLHSHCGCSTMSSEESATSPTTWMTSSPWALQSPQFARKTWPVSWQLVRSLARRWRRLPSWVWSSTRFSWKFGCRGSGSPVSVRSFGNRRREESHRLPAPHCASGADFFASAHSSVHGSQTPGWLHSPQCSFRHSMVVDVRSSVEQHSDDVSIR